MIFYSSLFFSECFSAFEMVTHKSKMIPSVMVNLINVIKFSLLAHITLRNKPKKPNNVITPTIGNIVFSNKSFIIKKLKTTQHVSVFNVGVEFAAVLNNGSVWSGNAAINNLYRILIKIFSSVFEINTRLYFNRIIVPDFPEKERVIVLPGSFMFHYFI